MSTIIGLDDGLSHGRRQSIIRTNAGMLLIGTLGTNFSEILIEIRAFSLRKCICKRSVNIALFVGWFCTLPKW